MDSTGRLMKYTGGGIGTLPQIERVDMGDGDELNSDGSDWDQYLQPDNLHGMKLYREPYDRDISDLFVALVLELWVSIVKISFFLPQMSI